jgi:hypothetical protein
MIGKVARCQRGFTGLVTYLANPGMDSVFYKGVCLDPGRVGKPWQSVNPEWLGTLDDWVRLRHAEILEEEEIAVEGVFRSAIDYPTRRDLT